MSVLLPTNPNGVPVPVLMPGAVTTVAIGAASVASGSGIAADAVVLTSDQSCHVAFGATPTATTSDFRLQAGTYLQLGWSRGDKIAVIQAAGAAAGTLFVMAAR